MDEYLARIRSQKFIIALEKFDCFVSAVLTRVLFSRYVGLFVRVLQCVPLENHQDGYSHFYNSVDKKQFARLECGAIRTVKVECGQVFRF
jgi:hypothetical protein